jgi:uncharacterized membrane protein YqgA involved in biofilm formation
MSEIVIVIVSIVGTLVGAWLGLRSAVRKFEEKHGDRP